jgi:hypothetical protein
MLVPGTYLISTIAKSGNQIRNRPFFEAGNFRFPKQKTRLDF